MRKQITRSIIIIIVASAACHHSPKIWTTTPPPRPTGPANVFDVTWGAADDNGLPLNPRWGSQSWVTGAMLPPAQRAVCAQDPRKCTGQRVVEDWAPDPSVCRLGVATGIDNAGPIPAHFDWSIATYTGILRPSFPAISDDDDYNFIFQPGDPDRIFGLTEQNADVPFDSSKKYIELEMLSHEVDQRFKLKWWSDFATDADRVLTADDADAQARIDDAWAPGGRLHRATIVGLFGVDCEHGCRSELHPVYALMVETDPDPSHNTWQMFARNWGSGGSCSTLNHEFQSPSLALRIPAPSVGVTPDHITDVQFARSDDSIAPPVFSRPSAGDGLLVTFTLAPPALQALEELMITIQWAGTPPSATPPPPPPPMAVTQPERRVRSAPTQKKQSESAYILAAVDALPAAQRDETRRQLVQALARPRRAAEQDRSVLVADQTIHSTPPQIGPPRPPAATTRLQDVTSDRTRKAWSILCEAYQGQLPPFNGVDISKVCAKVSWKRKK